MDPSILNICLLSLCVFGIQNSYAAYACSIQTECDTLAGNDVCDTNCNNLNCSYDGGDCLLQTMPWKNCGQATRCETSFYNETCDSVCNTEVCLYEEFKCKPLFEDNCITNCTYKWGNGDCDTECNKVQCGYDGNDCNNVGGSIQGTIVVYAKSSITLLSNSARFIGFSLSLATRTIVSIKNSLKYNGSVPEMESLGNEGLRIQYQIQNIPDCSTNKYTECWGSMENLANYGKAVGTVLNNFLKSIGVNVLITKVVACADGYYGENCTQACSVNCKSGCYIFDGTCIGGCIGSYSGDMCQALCSPNCKLGCFSGSTCLSGECNPGFYGSDCTTECSIGTYGTNCESNCSSGCVDRSCSKNDGTCSCISGFNGTMCEIECTDGTYGISCAGNCGNCQYGVACDKANGYCPAACSAGYYGTMCISVCPDGTHGSDCTANCTNCVNNTCDPVRGYCKAGCLTGWTGADCTTDITTIEYLPSTITTQIAVAVVVVILVMVATVIVMVVILWRRRNKDNYQSHLDTKIVIGEGNERLQNDVIQTDDDTDDVNGKDQQTTEL